MDINCKDTNNTGKIHNFVKTTNSTSPTGNTGTPKIPQIEESFMCVETSACNSSNENIFVSFDRTDIIQISNITFYYNRFSNSTSRLRSRGWLSDSVFTH